MQNLVTIGQFSELTQLTIKALRLYDKLGVLRPRVVDVPSGFRYYSLDQAATAERIRLLRSLQMPLDEIRALLTTDDPNAARRQLARHRQWLEERIVDYQQALTRLQILDDWYALSKERQPMGGTEYHCSLCGKNHMLARRFLTGPTGIHLCDECVYAADERAVAGPPLHCALCGGDTGRHYRMQSGAEEIGLCADCLMLCREMVG